MDKGATTHERIIGRALRLASRDGLGGLTIGTLAADLGLSKSGLFAHFGSKEELQLAVLHAAVTHFKRIVMGPAFKAPRGEPRLRALFEGWLDWGSDPALPGGCPFVAASIELDDKPGAPREFLVATQKEWLKALAAAARLGVEEAHFRADLDPAQLAFELYALILGYHHARRLLRDRRATARVRQAFDHLVDAARR